jgi:hypothetical protein
MGKSNGKNGKNNLGLAEVPSQGTGEVSGVNQAVINLKVIYNMVDEFLRQYLDIAPSGVLIQRNTQASVDTSKLRDFIMSLFDIIGVTKALADCGFYAYLDKGGYFTDPASVKYHGAFKGGLALHSLLVLWNCIRLARIMVNVRTLDLQSMLMACLFHDLVKMGSYELGKRNVKVKGKWEEVDCYNHVLSGSASHGAESFRRLTKYFNLSENWELAVIWHSGAYEVLPGDVSRLMYTIAKVPEVLLLQTADMMAGVVGNV